MWECEICGCTFAESRGSCPSCGTPIDPEEETEMEKGIVSEIG